MEGKERYEWDKIEEECYEWIRDTETVNQSLYYYLKTVAHLLNQQDKRIKELELLLKADKKIETNSLNGFEKLRKETQQLKQQLHELPKKILEEVEKNFTEYLPLKYKTGAGFYSRLNAILEKYGGEDE